MKGIFRDQRLHAEYVRNGFIVLDFLRGEEVQYLARIYEELPNDLPMGFTASLMSRDIDYRGTVSAAIEQTFDRRASEIFEDHKFGFCTFTVKRGAGQRSEVPLHQDWSFVDETRFQAVNIWCPLVDVGPENGCLQVIKGSHEWNTRPRGTAALFPYRDLLPALRQWLVDVPMRAGQAIIFSQRLFHSSPENRGVGKRVVATAVVAHRDSSFRCYYQDPSRPETIEIFEVDDDFYTRYLMGTRPRDGKSLGLIPYELQPLSEHQLLIAT